MIVCVSPSILGGWSESRFQYSDLDIVRVHLRPIEETTESSRVVNDSSDDIVKKPNNECYNVTLTRDM